MSGERRREEGSILLVEDDQDLGELLKEEIADMGFAARHRCSAEQAVSLMRKWMPDIIVSDLRLPGVDGLGLLQSVRESNSDDPPDFVIITAFGTVSKAVECLKAGAEDFLTKPVDLDHFKISLQRIMERRKLRRDYLRIRSLLQSGSTFHGMYGRSPVMQEVFRQIRQLAGASGPVLIVGESGTGKELVARAIHEESERRHGRFLAVNCAGIPKDLLESEFFGHESGAFTGASRLRKGIFEEAQGGTLLLDEISEMPLDLQAKLLRVLQDGKLRPVGSNLEKEVDVRVLAASNRDIERQVEEGGFREDLFYRLETFQLKLPPLRRRGGDIDLLTGCFLRKYSEVTGKRIEGLSPRAMELLHMYPFPGNVRELQNAIERAVFFCGGREIKPEHLPVRLRKHSQSSQGVKASEILESLVKDGDGLPSLETVELAYIRYALDSLGGNKRLAAEKLGIARRTLYRKIDRSP